jgi:biopolymer transport protein ExbD
MLSDTPRVRLASTRSRRPHRLGLTPLADLVFILLIFFILETSFVEFRQLDFQQPQPQKMVEAEGQGEQPAAGQDPEVLEIQVFASGRLWLAGEALSTDRLAAFLQARNPDPQTLVLVSSEPTVPAQLLVDVLDELHDAQLARVLVRELGADHD